MNQEQARRPRLGDEAWSYLGYEFDEYVTDATIRVRNEMGSALNTRYLVASEVVDLPHYLLQRPGLMNDPDFNPIKHFVHSKARTAPSPDINFSMKKYVRLHPDMADEPADKVYLDWLHRGRAEGEIADPAPGVEEMADVLGLSPEEVVAYLTEMRTDLHHRLRTGTLGEMFARAAEVEPLIADAWTEIARPKLLPFGAAQAVEMACALHACQGEAGFRRARLVMVINRPRWGGGRRIEGHISHALAQYLDPADLVVVYTDQDGEPVPSRYPPGVREVDLAGAIREHGLKGEQAQRVLVELLRSFHADAIVNINSRLLYQALMPYGHALAASERIFLCLFCNELSPRGTWSGYPIREFYRTFDLVEGVITDSRYLRDWLIERHQLGPADIERLQVFVAPVDPSIPRAVPQLSTKARRRPQVFWAGRWDRQKRIDVVLEVARRMPDVDFRMWGETLFNQAGVESLPDNVQPEGRYEQLSELPLSDADAWLYTSGWDGVPSQLLEVSMTEVPLVGTAVGGTTEILSSEDSWPVEGDDPAAYVSALRETLADPAEARRRATALRERMMRERGQGAFAKQALALLEEALDR